MKTTSLTFTAFTVVALSCTAAVAQDSTPANRLVIHTDQGRQTISRNIYGHFSEHLGRCIYEGIWVGEDSSIPNTRGIRNDVVAALKQIKVPVLRWPGGTRVCVEQLDPENGRQRSVGKLQALAAQMPGGLPADWTEQRDR